ncbi:MAG: C/D box methylation guide ribonucleoprotein complex aNOP56 subunit [Promethearchaeota archaeon]
MIYALLTATGLAITSEDGELKEFFSFGTTPEECVQNLLGIETGEPSKAVMKFLEQFLDEEVGSDQILIAQLFKDSQNFAFVDSDKVRKARAALPALKKQEQQILRDIALELCKTKIREGGAARDLLTAQALLSIDDLTSSVNLIANRLTEYYGNHFPELYDIVRDNEQYVRLIMQLGSRNNFKIENLEYLSEERAKKIVEAAQSSIGTDLLDSELQPILALAQLGVDSLKAKTKLEQYVARSMSQVAPTLNSLIGPILGARLISMAGGLYNLAKLPSSTVQVLGAEKALFRALKTGSAPPKHGILFQSNLVHNAPWYQRGKIARSLAAKISLAARIDYFTGIDMSHGLLEDLNKRITEIEKKFPEAPEKKPLKKQRRPKEKLEKRRRQKKQRRLKEKPERKRKQRIKEKK